MADFNIAWDIEFNRVRQTADRIAEVGDTIATKTAIDLEAGWKANIRAAGLIDTGAYINSVRAQQDRDGSWVVGTPLIYPPYPIFLEYGTSRGIPAHGVATRAAEDARREWDAAWRSLERAL